jgi:pimeloyl-ACP methyl ester carboxylesterase
LQLSRYHLLGHSLGAGIASMVAAAAPQTLGRLLVIEGLGPLGDDGERTLQRFRDALVTATNKSRGLRLFRDIDQAISARAVVSGLRADLARPIVERGLQQTAEGWHWRSDPRLTRSSAMRMAETQICSLLHGIDVPTALLLAQPATPYLGRPMMDVRAARVPIIDITEMDGGHHLHLEHPQAVADWVARHLDG